MGFGDSLAGKRRITHEVRRSGWCEGLQGSSYPVKKSSEDSTKRTSGVQHFQCRDGEEDFDFDEENFGSGEDRTSSDEVRTSSGEDRTSPSTSLL